MSDILRFGAASAKLAARKTPVSRRGDLRKLRPQRRDNSSSARGQQAVVEILSAARDVLVEEGYPRLTMRNVAERANMTVGNLSYYYANKQDLLHDLLEAVIQGYVADFDRIAANTERSPEERLEDMIRFLIGDLATKETTGFFPALWALANHDEFAAKEMSSVYEVERGVFARVISVLRPDLSKKDHDLLALFISASIEGQTMFIGHKREKAAAGEAIANIAAVSFTQLVKGIDAAAIRGLKIASKAGGKKLAS
ncbi:MAG: hypothetical protein A3E78_14350 [Alphaproteobacteria bacterium RIFCSPHIGHO2_12_FULL_63_12]|nr:MAG: hypothetical protein A3E78_14350 [Alphaproteobacteria bacterium RIFCSPHIGHO2_12_FULL_63_12]